MRISFADPYLPRFTIASDAKKGDDGEVYTGLGDGRVVMLDQNGENPQDIFFTGGFVSAAGRALGTATGLDYGHNLLEICCTKVTWGLKHAGTGDSGSSTAGTRYYTERWLLLMI